MGGYDPPSSYGCAAPAFGKALNSLIGGGAMRLTNMSLAKRSSRPMQFSYSYSTVANAVADDTVSGFVRSTLRSGGQNMNASSCRLSET